MSERPGANATLAEWLDYQQHLHTRAIDLGLVRVRAVWQRLGARRPAPVVITVGGTNGKGSTVAMLEAMLAGADFAVGSYTSPHLVRYNERVRIRGGEADDAALVAAFERVEAARADTGLTWFEFGTLAAFELLAAAELDVAVLEVGLGGRLDAVNLVDADAAAVVTVDLDHTEYLGPDRDAIGREKAGIFRAGRPAVIGDADAPRGLLETAAASAARVWLAGRDFRLRADAGGALWQCGDASLRLPSVSWASRCQFDNAATALTLLYSLRERLGWPVQRYTAALKQVRVPARIETVADSPQVIVDVAHNVQAVGALAAWLRGHACLGRNLAVFSALVEKDVAGIAAALGPQVDHWYCAAINDAGARGQSAAAVREHVVAGWPQAVTSCHASVLAALAAARSEAAPDDRIVAFGSFHVAGVVRATMWPV